MTEPVRIKPAGKNLLRNPDGMAMVPPEGAIVTLDSYWLRRIKDGDAEVVQDTKKEESK